MPDVSFIKYIGTLTQIINVTNISVEDAPLYIIFYKDTLPIYTNNLATNEKYPI